MSDEAFLPESQLKESLCADGKKLLISADSGHPVEWTEEQNYMFQLNSFKDDLLYWLRTNGTLKFSFFFIVKMCVVDSIIRPSKFQQILLDMIQAQKEDLSVSRPSSRVHWGIPVPGDPSQTVYVWLDALANYLTAAKYVEGEMGNFKNIWPPNLQVIGKDILK